MLKHNKTYEEWRMALVGTEVSEERIASVIRVKRISGLGTLAAGSSILVTLMMEAIIPSGKSVVTEAARRRMPEDGVLHNKA
jgi:hypothetical protein